MTKLERKILKKIMFYKDITMVILAEKLHKDLDDLYPLINHLFEEQYLQFCTNDLRRNKKDNLIYRDDRLEVSYKGKCALELDRDERAEKRIMSIRYYITTAISVIALILAILAHLRQWHML